MDRPALIHTYFVLEPFLFQCSLWIDRVNTKYFSGICFILSTALCREPVKTNAWKENRLFQGILKRERVNTKYLKRKRINTESCGENGLKGIPEKRTG